MSKTIKELANEFGVTKTTVRKRLTPEFRANYVETTANGVIVIDEIGCKIIGEALQPFAEVTGNTANQIANPTANLDSTEIVQLLRVTVDTLNNQLAEKDKQIAAKNEQITVLQSQLITMNESINKQSLQLQQLTDSLSAAGEPRKKRWWQKWRK